MAFDAYSAPAPIEHPALTKQRLRQRLTRLIDRLVCALDEIDDDPDLEDTGDDEPSLAHPEARAWDSQAAVAGWLPIGGVEFTDLEDQCEDEGAVTGDDEPETAH